MIGLGLLLLIVGVVLIVLASMVPQVPAPLGQVGWLLAVVGVVLVVIGALSDEVEVSTWIGGGLLALAVVGPGGPFPPDDDPTPRRRKADQRVEPVRAAAPAPAAPAEGSGEPVILAFVVGAIPLFAAALAALAEVFTGMPDWIVPTFTVLGTLTTGLAAMWARLRVTPTADPKLDDGTRLVPEVGR